MLIHRAKKESIPDIVKRFDANLEVTDKLIMEEIEEADKKFVEKLIQLFMDVKNKVKK